ncbi:MAG: hypothetical protein ACYTAN_18690, partial [Planctomycetota bacterium]
MALYAFLRDDAEDETIHVYKCTGDPETPANWTSQDTYRFDGEVYDLCAFVQGGDIHIAVSCAKTKHGVGADVLASDI